MSRCFITGYYDSLLGTPPPLEIGLKESHINPKNPFKRGDPYFSEYTIVFNIQISAGFNG